MDMLSQHEQRNGEAWPAPPPSPIAKPFSRVHVDADGYPYSDGEPLAQNTRQCDEILYAAAALKTQHAGNPDTFVASDLLLHYRQGDRRASVAPDVFVAFGAGSHERLSYKLWEERVVPSFALEVLSGSSFLDRGSRLPHESTFAPGDRPLVGLRHGLVSADRDMNDKRVLYARLGIEEFWLFDPFGDRIEGHLLGLRLRRAAYEPIPPLGGGAGYLSAVLNLEFRNESRHLRIRDPATGEDLKSHQEAVEECWQERRSRQEAEVRAAEAEARIAELEALSLPQNSKPLTPKEQPASRWAVSIRSMKAALGRQPGRSD